MSLLRLKVFLNHNFKSCKGKIDWRKFASKKKALKFCICRKCKAFQAKQEWMDWRTHMTLAAGCIHFCWRSLLLPSWQFPFIEPFVFYWPLSLSLFFFFVFVLQEFYFEVTVLHFFNRWLFLNTLKTKMCFRSFIPRCWPRGWCNTTQHQMMLKPAWFQNLRYCKMKTRHLLTCPGYKSL